MRYKGMLIGISLVLSAVTLTACGNKDQGVTEKATQQDAASTEKESATKGKDNMSGDTNKENQASYKKITQEAAKERMDSQDELVILDVRTEEEYNEDHIEGAILIPNEEIKEEPLEQIPDMDTEILLYCRSGVRSKEAANKLVNAGYTNVFDMGGIIDWPYDTVADNQGKTDTDTDEAGDSALGAFTAKTLDGKEVTQDIFKEHDLTMVNVWATFCGPCLREMPDLGEINRAYADKGFQIVGIVTDVLNQDATVNDEQIETANYAVEQTKADYTHIIPSMDLMQGFLSNIMVVPTTIFVDKNGKQVGENYEGAKEKSDWEAIIEELLQEVK